MPDHGPIRTAWWLGDLTGPLLFVPERPVEAALLHLIAALPRL